MSVYETIQFGELTPNARMKQWLAFAIIVGNQRIDEKMARIRQLAEAHTPPLPREAQIENDQLWEQVVLIRFHNELLKLIALDIH